MASIAGIEGQIGQLAYGAAKAGIIGMTIVAARDLVVGGGAGEQHRPGHHLHPGLGGAPRPSSARASRTRSRSRKRFGKPTEFAQLAEHLLTNDYMNGHVARIDGAIRFDPK